MLSRVCFRDFVIVDALELEFSPGFTVLTGETGAGKSILIDALALALGERADAGVVRTGCERAEIAAEFDLGRLPAVVQWLKDNQLEGDEGVVFLRRTVDAGGRSRAFINGRAATAQQLKEIGDQLVDIHGQHAHQSMLRRDAQRTLLDDFAGLTELARIAARRFQTWQHIRSARLELARNASAVAAEREQLAWQIDELAALAFVPEAWTETIAEHSRLSHAASLIEAGEAALATLSESESSVVSAVSATLGRLRALVEVDARLNDVTDILESANIQLQEAVYGLRHYLQRVELDPARLAELESRMRDVHEMARKHRIKPEDLPACLADKQARLDALGGNGNEEELLAREQAAETACLDTARKLSTGRTKAAAALSAEVSASMQTIAMSGGKFQVTLQPNPAPASFGLEQVEFQISTHVGMPPAPLAKVASGGELSRISLALQVVLSKVAAVPTLIFDEVDAGIGGRVAEIVGQMLKTLGETRQVMCVTHLPQVAARGNQHGRVSKSLVGGVTRSRIDLLRAEERVEELARMLGGVKITDTTRKHAKEMLGVK